MVRGAGFPVRDVLAFADDAHAAARALVASPRFREAVAWQSRSALRDGMDRLGEANTSKQRRRERLVASYAQRYCTKNDSIGFFGPFACGEIDRDVAALEVRPGPALLARRRVYFEQWAIDVLAEALVEREALRPFIAPRLAPIVAIEGTKLTVPIAREVEVAPVMAALLACCDGATPAREIARSLLAHEAYELDDEEEVFALLDDLAAKRFITWTLEVPSSITRPEDALARLLDAMPPSGGCDRARAAVQRLSSARDALAGAAGDPHAVADALDRLDATFLELTGEAALRGHGKTYAARGIVYEDCRRDLEITLGAAVVMRIERVIALLGGMARWFTHEVATRVRVALQQIHDELGGASVPYLQFWAASEPLWSTDPRTRMPLVDAVVAELGRRWAEALAIAPGETSVERTIEQLDMSAFAAPAPGWPSARHVAPDVMIAARGLDALRRGDLVPVIGEVHIGNKLLSLYGLQECPDPAVWIAANDVDLGTGRVSPVESRRLAGRADTVHWSTGDLNVETGASRSWRPRHQILRAADLVVENHAGALIVLDRPSGRRFDIIAFFEQYLVALTSGHFKLQSASPRMPRVTIDGVIVSRAQWTFVSEDLSVARGDRAAQFETVRAWAREHGLPRYVFVRVPHETKPIYVDFESPLFVELMLTFVRKAAEITIVEMVPAPDETWLPDHDGKTYACELRLVAVDPVAWSS
jgi:hypothetical protein